MCVNCSSVYRYLRRKFSTVMITGKKKYFMNGDTFSGHLLKRDREVTRDEGQFGMNFESRHQQTSSDTRWLMDDDHVSNISDYWLPHLQNME